MNTFEQLGFTMPGFTNGINNTVSEMAKPEQNVSWYFMSQMASMVFAGWLGRKTALQQNSGSISLQEELNQKKMEFGRAKQEEDIEFLRECHVLGMQQQKELAINACKDRQTEEEFRLFCNKWQSRFRPQINAILEDLQNQNIDENGVPMMKLLIASTQETNTGSGKYQSFCETFSTEIVKRYGLGIDTSWIRSWNKECVSSLADTMNLHYIMQGLPTVILYPMTRGDKVSIEIASWNYSLGQSNLLFDKTLQISKSELTENKLHSILAIVASYIDDVYRVMIHHSVPSSIYKIEGILNSSDDLKNIAIGKYKSLLAMCQGNKGLITDNSEIKKLENTINL